MALQHFYSRVPAKISMYNRTDSFDTFACSDGISRDFALKELAQVDDLKLTIQEIEKIRDGKMPPVFCQFPAPGGLTVQSRISFLPTDFSGERTSYLVHSLILEGKERDDLLFSPDANAINKSLFVTDLSGFNITGSDARPDREYPELEYIPEQFESNAFIFGKTDADTLCRFIYAVLSALTGRTKCVYVLNETPEEMLRIANAVFSVLPAHFRAVYSFATSVNSITQFPSFRLKGIRGDHSTVPTLKGCSIEFAKYGVTGVRNEDFLANIRTVKLFYALLKKDTLRHEFLSFTKYIADRKPELFSLNLRNLGEVSFLFICGCGFFEVNNWVPNDETLFELLSLYETFRDALPDEYRMRIIGTVKRYPEARKEYPKKIFAKLQRLYPGEIYVTRRIIMDGMLDLIHTEVMREKLFGFIKLFYDREDDETKASILTHLCGVFYGGFLQSQLLAFFRDCFDGSSEESKRQITEKVLLAIRTKTMRGQILEFFDAMYGSLGEEEKHLLYNTVLEQLPEGDEASADLLAFTDAHITDETEEFRASFFDGLAKELDTEQHRAEHPMLAMIARTGGICEEKTAERIVTVCTNRKILPEYIALLFSGNAKEATAALLMLCRISDPANDAQKEKLKTAVTQSFPTVAGKYSTVNLLDTAKALDSVKDGKELAGSFCTSLIKPLIARSLCGIFSAKGSSVTVDALAEFAKSDNLLRTSEQYKVLCDYIGFRNAIIGGKGDDAVRFASSFPNDKKLRAAIADYARRDLADAEKSAETAILSELVLNYLATGKYSSTDLYRKYSVIHGAVVPKKEREDKSIGAACMIIGACRIIDLGSASDPEMRKALTDESSGVREIITTVVPEFGRRAASEISEAVEGKHGEDSEFSEFCTAVIDGAKPRGGLFRRLFGK